MVEKQILPNGARILTERVPGVRSATLGLWVASGSRHERAAENGAAHFIEHMVFKGTATRSAAQLAEEMDAVGGQVNAFTTKENTCFHARVLDSHLPRAIDLLCDMIFSSRFDDADVETERGVILEEVGMYEDNPEDLCAERLLSAVYHGSALARPILGRRATLERMDGAFLREYMRTHYLAGDMVAALAGSFTDRDVEDLRKRLSSLPAGKLPPVKRAAYQSAVAVKKKATEQNHLTLAFPGLPYGHPDRYALQLLSSILGGGMSSRLWQELREKRGLCYSVYSYGAGHEDTGVFAVYTALSRELEAQALAAIADVVREFAQNGASRAELDRAREQSKANVLLGLESTQAHMSNLGRGELLNGKVLGPDDIIAAYDAVSREDVLRLARIILDFKTAALSAVGRVEGKEAYQEFLGKQ